MIINSLSTVLGEQLEDIPHLFIEAQDHDCINGPINDFAMKYVAGFTARRWKKSAKCDLCTSSLIKPHEKADANDLITVKSKYCLTYPSDALTSLVDVLERSIMEFSCDEARNQNL